MMAISVTSGSYVADFEMLASSRQLIILMLLVVALFVGGHVLIALSISDKNATLAGVVEMSYPFFIALFSWALFGESTLNLATGIGGALILVGIALVYLCGH
jgi:drug/metabolite transporter (DMT)-like permease